MVPETLKKRGGLSTHNSSAEEVGLEAFFYLAAQNFELLQDKKNFRSKLKIFKHVAADDLTKTFAMIRL